MRFRCKLSYLSALTKQTISELIINKILETVDLLIESKLIAIDLDFEKKIYNSITSGDSKCLPYIINL